MRRWVAAAGTRYIAGSDTGVSASDGITNHNTPTVTGAARRGPCVTLYDGTTKVGSAVADKTTGIYTITAAALANGTHTLTAATKDTAGKVSASVGAVTLTVDTLAPATRSAEPSAHHPIAARPRRMG